MKKNDEIKIAGLLGIIGNIFLLVIKSIVSIISNSQSMLADTFNSASDIFASVMTYIGNKIASKKADDDHNLGHGKAEYVYSLLISVIMFLLAYKVLKSSIMSFFGNSEYIYSNWLLVVCIVTIVTKLCLFIYTRYVSVKYHNMLIKSNSIDHINDCLLTGLNLFACIMSRFGFNYIDGVVGTFISLWIIYQAFKILMDKAISDEIKNRVYEIIKTYPEIKKVIHFNSTPVGYRYQISFTIYVDGKMSTYDSHFIANKLEKEIDKKIDEIYLTVIHVNPIEEDKDDIR